MIKHAAEGRTELIAKIHANRLEQAIKSIVVQVRVMNKENIYCLANVSGGCRIDLDGITIHFKADSAAFAALQIFYLERFSLTREVGAIEQDE